MSLACVIVTFNSVIKMYNDMVKVLIKVCQKSSAGGQSMILKIQYYCHSFLLCSKQQKPLGHTQTDFENQRSNPAKSFSAGWVPAAPLVTSGDLFLAGKSAHAACACFC